MKYVVAAIAALALTGCSQMQPTTAEHAYRVAKGVYQIGKKIVIINEDLIGEEALENLKKIDEYAGRIDKVHEMLVDEAGKHDAGSASKR